MEAKTRIARSPLTTMAIEAIAPIRAVMQRRE